MISLFYMCLQWTDVRIDICQVLSYVGGPHSGRVCASIWGYKTQNYGSFLQCLHTKEVGTDTQINSMFREGSDYVFLGKGK